MFEIFNFPLADVLESVRKLPLSGWFTLSGVWIFKGAVQGGCSRLAEYMVDSYCINHGKEKRYDVCEKDFDFTKKPFLDEDAWLDMTNPYFKCPISICLCGTNAKDEDLMKNLVNQKYLRKLDVSHCPNITWKGVQEFRKARPDCKVYHTTLRFWNYMIGFIICSGTLIRFLMDFLPFID